MTMAISAILNNFKFRPGVIKGLQHLKKKILEYLLLLINLE